MFAVYAGINVPIIGLKSRMHFTTAIKLKRQLLVFWVLEELNSHKLALFESIVLLSSKDSVLVLLLLTSYEFYRTNITF